MDLGKASIPLFPLLAGIPVFVGFIFWLSTVANQSEATAKTVDKLEAAIYQIKDDVSFLRAKEEIRERRKHK